jgi:hypothetical protein
VVFLKGGRRVHLLDWLSAAQPGRDLSMGVRLCLHFFIPTPMFSSVGCCVTARYGAPSLTAVLAPGVGLSCPDRGPKGHLALFLFMRV